MFEKNCKTPYKPNIHEAIYDICRRNLDIERPSYANLNRLIGQVSYQGHHNKTKTFPLLSSPLKLIKKTCFKSADSTKY